MQRKSLGSLRRVDCIEAEVVLASGVYLTFRLDASRAATVGNLVEVRRSRMDMQPRESILVDARILQKARAAAFDAIIAHRTKMHLPAPKPVRPPKPYQPKLPNLF